MSQFGLQPSAAEMARASSPALVSLAPAAVGVWFVRHLRAPAVRRWRPGGGRHERLGVLSARIAGGGAGAVVLLHGLVGSGDFFGADYDRLAAQRHLIVPDLLGFGRSLDRQRRDHSLAAHLSALDEMLAAAGLAHAPLTVGGHSMGGVLALHWAASRADQVHEVVTWGALLYRSRAEARQRIAAMGLLEALFALDGPLAHLACKLTCCAQPASAGWLAVAMNPTVPVALARRASQHTWASFVGAMGGIIMGSGWQEALQTLDAANVPVTLAAGKQDPVPVPRLAAALAQRYTTVSVEFHPRASHHLPISEPAWSLRPLTGGRD